MFNFLNLYNSFEEFYDSFFKGNEIEFLYRGQRFYILPRYNDKGNITGVYLGAFGDEKEAVFTTKDELYNAKIGVELLGNILSQIEITWYNI